LKIYSTSPDIFDEAAIFLTNDTVFEGPHYGVYAARLSLLCTWSNILSLRQKYLERPVAPPYFRSGTTENPMKFITVSLD
jgi:hypothetical protein